MRKKWLLWTWALVLSLCLLMPQRAATQETSTPEERAKWAEVTHKLETSPLDEAVNKEGEWALKRISDIHDFHVPLCPGLLNGFNGLKYIYAHSITRQYMLASAAFVIESPDKASDANALNQSAVESVLKLYGAIVRQRPQAKPKMLDDLLKKQSQGKLKDFVQKQCH